MTPEAAKTLRLQYEPTHKILSKFLNILEFRVCKTTRSRGVLQIIPVKVAPIPFLCTSNSPNIVNFNKCFKNV